MSALLKFKFGGCRHMLMVLALFFAGAARSSAQPANTDTNWPSLAELLKKWEPVPLPEIQKTAEQGNLMATHYLGYCFTEGLRVPQNPSQGVIWYQRALQGGYIPAANNLGVLYQRGRLGFVDMDKAVYYYKFAASHGLAQSQANMGVLYRDGKGVPRDYAEAMRWLQMAAAQHHAEAMVEIGRFYRFGRGVATNLAEARRWFQQALNEKDNASARLNMAWLYQADGQPAEAIPYIQQAADQGSTDAMAQLYCCYWDGNGVQTDQAQAMYWLNKSAMAGNANAEYLMGYRAEARDWVDKGADEHLSPHHWPEAFHWYRKSAEQNWPMGQYHLGLLYLAGEAVEMDEARGLDLVRAAADQGLDDARYELACLYARGVGEPRSEKEQPMALLQQLGKWSDLELRYEYGLGTSRDLVMAAACFSKKLLKENEETPYYSADEPTAADLAGKIEFQPPRDKLMGTPMVSSPDHHGQIIGPLHRVYDAEPDVLRALSPYLKSALGDGAAAYQIGNFYLAGSDVPPSITRAWAWFQTAARNGFNPAHEAAAKLEKQMTAGEKNLAQEQLSALTADLRQVAPVLR